MAIPIPNSTESSTAEIVFFDLETNVPNKLTGQKFSILEFGAIVVCPRKLIELKSYCTLIRPGDLSVAPLRSSRSYGITRGDVQNAPVFEEVADNIYEVLNGRIWAGHNIQRFDCVRIREAFKEIGRPAPLPNGMIDSLGVLTEKFGRRAGNMKMASLAEYFGLGQQKHRSLDDCRMNLEVLKHCATVLFLESNLPSELNSRWQVSPNMTTRSRSSALEQNATSVSSSSSNSSPCMTTRSRVNLAKSPPREETKTTRKSPLIPLGYHRTVPYARGSLGKVTSSVANILRNAQNRPLSNLLKHSHSLLQ